MGWARASYVAICQRAPTSSYRLARGSRPEFRRVLSDAASDRLDLVVHDYTAFAGAAGLTTEMTRRLGGIDDDAAPIRRLGGPAGPVGARGGRLEGREPTHNHQCHLHQ